MADTQLSTYLWVLDGASAEEIADSQDAIDSMTVDIDTLVTVRANIVYKAESAMPQGKYGPAWGYSPPGRDHWINRALGTNKRRYTVLHEAGGHQTDRDLLNTAKHEAIMAYMHPLAGGSTGVLWNDGAYIDTPNECYADQFVRMYSNDADIKNPLEGWYGRQIHSADYAAVRAIIIGASGPVATTLAATASIGTTNIKVASVTGMVAGGWLAVGNSTSPEQVQMLTVGTSGSGGSGITLTAPTTALHNSGANVVETSPAPPSDGDGRDEVVIVGTPNNSVITHTITGLTLGISGIWRIRFYDGQTWGPYTDDQPVQLAITPGRPLNVTVTPGTKTPDFGATLNSPDPGDYVTHWTCEVQQNVGGVWVLKMQKEADTGVTDLRRVTIAYDGSVGGPLEWDQEYRFILTLTNRYGITVGMASYQYFTPTEGTGPLVAYGGLPLSTDYKINTLVPTFVLSDRDGLTIDQPQLRVWASDKTTLLWDSGVLTGRSPAATQAVQVPVDILAWNDNPWIDARKRIFGTGALGEYSEKAQVHLNAAPGAPTGMGVSDVLYQVVQRDDGVWVTATATPTITFPFIDSDLPAYAEEAPAVQTVEIVDEGGAPLGASPYTDATAPAQAWTVPGGLLVADTTAQVRAQYVDGSWDGATGATSPFSDYVAVRYSLPPVVTLTAPAGALLTDPTPAFVWDYSSPSGKPQAGSRLVLSVAGTTIYDSGVVASSAHEAGVPAGVLTEDAQHVDYQLMAYDSDGLAGAVYGSLTTAFVVPAALTGLQITPDVDAKGLLLEWDQSADAVFQAYVVRVRTPASQYEVVAYITDITQHSLMLLAAPHNMETLVRLTQTNGYAESAAADKSATLGAERSTAEAIRGYWLVTPDTVVLLPNATGHRGDSQTDLEVFRPAGAEDKVILDWGTTGYEGSLAIFTQDRALVDALRTWKEAGQVAILKTWYGAVRYVRLTDTPDSDAPAAWIQGTLSYIEVGRAAATF